MFLTVEDGLILGPICWILGKLFNLIYQFVAFVSGNEYANLSICVILFTVVIRGILFPLYFKQQRSSKIMSFIQPEISKATKKYNGKTDQESMMEKNKVTQDIQKKYGVNMTSGCLTSLIQLPVFYGLYRVIQNIPAYVTSMSAKYSEIVTGIKSATISSDVLSRLGLGSDADYVDVINAIATDSDGKVSTAVQAAQTMMSAKEKGELTDNMVIDVLDKISSSDWQQIIDSFQFSSDSVQSAVSTYVDQFQHMNQFLFGLNISNAPGWSMSVAILVPIVSALLQFVSTKISMKASQNNNMDPSQQTANKMMNGMAIYMPIMSFIFCINLPIAIGIYWIIGSVVMIVSQLIVNAYYNHQDKDELLAKCIEKAAKKKAKKKNPDKKSFYEKMMDAQAGNVTTENKNTDSINKMASSRLKSYNNPASSINSGDGSDNRPNVTYKSGSIGSKANIMLQYQNNSNDKGGKK